MKHISNTHNYIALFLLFLLFRKLFTLIIMGTLQKLAKMTNTYHDDKIISALKSPVRFTFILIGTHLFFLLIFKDTELIRNILNTLVVFTIFWTILSVLESMRGLFHQATEKFNSDLAKEMGNFILKIIKFFIGALGLGAMLQVWGINVTALVASLGLGGLAFALAAKDTASNMFGSFALLADKSIRIGEWIKVDGDVATVGITDFAQGELGDIVYVEIETEGETIALKTEIENSIILKSMNSPKAAKQQTHPFT